MLANEVDTVSRLLFILMGCLVLCAGATLLFRSSVPKLIARMLGTDNAEQRYLFMLREAYAAREKVRGLQAEYERVEDSRSRMESDQRKIQRQRDSAEMRAPDFIHEVNEYKPGLNRYVMRLSVDHDSIFLRPSSDYYNHIWHYVNLVEVWAFSREEARQLAELAYPEKLGYLKKHVDTTPPFSEGETQ